VDVDVDVDVCDVDIETVEVRDGVELDVGVLVEVVEGVEPKESDGVGV